MARSDGGTRKAIRDSIMAQSAGALMDQVLLQAGVLSLLVLVLGGGKFEVGLIWTANFLAQGVRIFAAPRADVTHPRTFLLRGLTLSTVISAGYLAIGGVASVFDQSLVTVWWVLGVFMASRLVLNWGVTAWFPLLAEVLPRRLLGRYFGRMRMSWRLTSTIAAVIAGWWLGTDPDLWAFYPIFIVGLLGLGARVLLMRRMPNPPPRRQGPPAPVFANLMIPLADPLFRRFLILIGLMLASTAAINPFLVPYLRVTLEFPSSSVVYATTSLSLGAVFALTPWGALADRWGNRFTLLLSQVFSAAGLVMFVFTPSYDSAPVRAMVIAILGNMLIGVGSAGLGIGATVRLIRSAPEDRRSTYTSIHTAVMGLITAAAAFGSGALLDALPTETTIAGEPVFVMQIALCLAAGLHLACGPLLRTLPPAEGEPSIHRAVSGVVNALPGPVALPLVPLRAYLDLLPTKRPRKSRRASRPGAETD